MTLKDLIEEAHTLVPKISCKNFAKNSDKYFLIDVREGTEIAETGSIANAVNIPRGLIEMKLTPNNPDKSLNANTPIIVYCGGGSRASLAGKTLIELGFKNVQKLEGGFRGWKEFSS
jgi:rhodanese-related sulfurtransferase